MCRHIGGPLSLTEEQGICDHDKTCGCYLEGYTAGMAQANTGRPSVIGATFAGIEHLLNTIDQRGQDIPCGCHAKGCTDGLAVARVQRQAGTLHESIDGRREYGGAVRSRRAARGGHGNPGTGTR